MLGSLTRLASSPWASAAVALACSGGGASQAALAPTAPVPAPASPAVPASPASPAPSSSGSVSDCEENRALAVELATAGDRAFKLDVDKAIEHYRRSLEVFPTEHSTLWKLAYACEKKEDWPCMVEALTRASELAPESARYWSKLGYVSIMLGEAGETAAFERAKAPLRRCIELDANFAECHHFLGVALEWTNDAPSALAAYSASIERDPESRLSYPALAALYLNLGLHAQAKVVAKEGIRLIPMNTRNYRTFYELNMLSLSAARIEGDRAEALRSLEQASLYSEDAYREDDFALGSAYALLEPPQEQLALQFLSRFMKRVCRGSAAARFQRQCETSAALTQRLGGDL